MTFVHRTLGRCRLGHLDLAGRVERRPPEGPGTEESLHMIGGLVGNASDEPQQLAHDGGARHCEGQLDHALAEPGDLACRIRNTAGEAAPVEVELCREAAERDRHIVRVLDPNPRQESHLQALPGNRFETSEAHPQWFAQTGPGARGQRRDHTHEEGGTADHGAAPPWRAAARVLADDRGVAWLPHGSVSSPGSYRFSAEARV